MQLDKTRNKGTSLDTQTDKYKSGENFGQIKYKKKEHKNRRYEIKQ